MTAAIDALGLPIQMLTVGSVLGTMVALRRYTRTGETDRWPVYVGRWTAALFCLGVLISMLEALF